MTSVASPAAQRTPWRGAPAVRLAEVVVFGVLPLLVLGYVFGQILFADLAVYAVFPYTVAADAILHWQSPYPALDDPDFLRGAGYVYPPLTAIVSTPLTLVSLEVAEVVVMVVLIAVAGATLAVVGVRDWRCYGVVFLWPPVLSAIQTGNITLVMALAAALVWRFRDRGRASGISLGLSLAAKLYLWPLGVWMLATRRYRAAIWSAVVAVTALTVTWAAIGFRGLVDYPSLLRRLSDMEDEWGFSVFSVALDLGVGESGARALWLACAIAVLAFAVLLGRRGEERGAFVLAVAAAIAFSPIVWLHYFALLLVVAAVAEQRLGLVWFAPLLLYGTNPAGDEIVPVLGNGTPLQNAATVAVAALTVGLAVRASLTPRAARSDRAGLSPQRAAA
jgi:hypothetical protein